METNFGFEPAISDIVRHPDQHTPAERLWALQTMQRWADERNAAEAQELRDLFNRAGSQ
jgi:hypothetical protein